MPKPLLKNMSIRLTALQRKFLADDAERLDKHPAAVLREIIEAARLKAMKKEAKR